METNHDPLGEKWNFHYMFISSKGWGDRQGKAEFLGKGGAGTTSIGYSRRGACCRPH